MKRKQRKSLPWRRFGYVILIIKFGEVLLWFSPRIINALRSYIKHSKECFIRYPITSKLVKKTRLRLVFSIHFLVFGYLMKHSSSCLIYYIKIAGWNSVKCDILSDPMHVRVAMIAKNYVGQNSEIKVLKDNPQLLARINFNYWGQIWTKIIHNVAEAFPWLCYSWFVQPLKGL